MLVFLDLETTGLVPTTCAVLEVACIITDDQLNEIARFTRVIRGTAEFHTVDEFVRNMHTVNGLWADLRASTDDNSQLAVDEDLAAFIRKHAVRVVTDDKGRKSVDRPQLAGNTISFDRAFMKVHLPRAEAELHYRNLDVSSINELTRRFFPDVYKARPNAGGNPAHRAMADCEESLKTARYYAKALAAAPPEFSGAV